jgi:hypothetical protein
LTSPADNLKGNGGIHAYSINRLLSRTPVGVDPNPLVPPPTPTPQALAAWNSYALTPGGAKAIYRTAVRTQSEPNVCTSHVFHQIPGQNRIFMAWYSQGTQVVDFIEHPNGTFEFRDAGWFIPENASTWTSAVFKYQNNGNGTFTYWGATGDFNLGTAGRNAVDVWKVTLPAPPAGPTAVSLIRFKATASRRGVLVRWQTAVENKTLGFNVFRTRGGRLEKVNRALIPARGGAKGAVYSLLDRKPVRGRPTYRLQVVELGGKKVWHGSTTLER